MSTKSRAYLKSSLSLFFFHLKTPTFLSPFAFLPYTNDGGWLLAIATSEQIGSIYFHLGGFCIHSIITEVKSSAPILKFHIFISVIIVQKTDIMIIKAQPCNHLLVEVLLFHQAHNPKLTINPVLCLTALPQRKFFAHSEYSSCLLSLLFLSYHTSSAFHFVEIPMSSILGIL